MLDEPSSGRCSSRLSPALSQAYNDVRMARRFLVVTVCLVATVRSSLVSSSPARRRRRRRNRRRRKRRVGASGDGHGGHRPARRDSFADIAEQLNPAVVNIDATIRAARSRRGGGDLPLPDSPDGFGRPPEREREGPRRGAGTGFIIDADRLHPHQSSRHRGADRINGPAGRRAHAAGRACRLGSDTDIALIKGRRRDRCRMRRLATPTRCGWVNGCWPSATRWPTSTRSPWAS